MVNQPQLLEAVQLRSGSRLNVQVGKREQAGASPTIDDGLDFGRPHQVGGAIWSGLLDGNVIVGTSDLVLCAVFALRKAFITSDMSLLASLTALAGLGVTEEKS